MRDADRLAIRTFVQNHRELLHGKVLDFGCGKQPYREFVSGEYVGYDPREGLKPEIAGMGFDAILCTQVFQEFETPSTIWRITDRLLKPGGCLIATYHPNWYEVEKTDLLRYSRAGIRSFLIHALTEEEHEPILSVRFLDFSLTMTYGYVGRRPQN